MDLHRIGVMSGPATTGLPRWARVVGVVLLVSCPSPSMAGSSKELRNIYELFESGEHEEANKKLAPLLAEENLDARGLLGITYLFGLGRKKDPLLAYQLCNEAALAGQPMGQHCLGHIYSSGTAHIEQDLQLAAKWWAKAVAKEDWESMYHLGESYYYGQGIKPDKQEALRLWRRAADEGNEKYALMRMGYLYGNDQLVEKDKRKKFEYFAKALQAGLENPDVKLQVGEWYLSLETNEEKRQKWLGLIEEAASSYPLAMLRQGYFCLAGTYEPRDYACAKRWYKKALMTAPVKIDVALIAWFGVTVSEVALRLDSDFS